jgi:ion channel POLLUX/CASTOR
MSFRHVLRYRFDNLMARGVLAQILLLAVVTSFLVIIGTVAIVALDLTPAPDAGKEADTVGLTTWKSLMRAMDPGTLAGDNGSWSYLFVLFFLTVGGIFVLSALIGVLNNGFGQMLERLRRGRSVVIEKDHTVILGWTPKIHTLLAELVEANKNQRKACVVVLADRDKVDMDVDVAASIGKAKLRIVTRSGNPMTSDDLSLVNLPTSRSVIVLAPEVNPDGSPMALHESDTVVLKTLLALAKASPDRQLHVVAEIYDARSEAVARMVAGENAALILAMPLISRLLVQTGRQSGLSVVYTELLDFAGSEIYVKPEPTLTGVTFRDAIHRYDTSSLIGVLTVDGETLVPPPLDRKFVAGDNVIAISEDDDTVVLDGSRPTVDDHQMVARAKTHVPEPERTLVLGTGSRLATVLCELDSYVAPGSETLVVGEQAVELPKLEHMKCALQIGDLTDRGVLDALNVTSFDHILALSETTGRTQDMADARTMVTLLHLRDLERIANKKVSITSEILDINNRDLATISEADDFIVSNTLVSLMVSQVSENPHLVAVFDELFGSEGHEIYLKPASDYVKPGKHNFATVCESALRRNEIAIGYRLAATSNDQAASYGVTINPAKTSRIELGAADRVIVLAEA